MLGTFKFLFNFAINQWHFTNFDIVEAFNDLDILQCPFYNTWLNLFIISYHFPGRITISSTFIESTSGITSTVASAVLWTAF